MTSATQSPRSRDARIKPVTELASRLARELTGEVLFDQASRARLTKVSSR